LGVNVIPPADASFARMREVSLDRFSIAGKLHQGESIGGYSIYQKQIKTLSSNAYFFACALLSTADAIQQ
jgi:hypothetical protein